MALKDWVRNDGFIENPNSPSPLHSYSNDESFIMLVRTIQYQDVKSGNYTRFPNLYDVASANKGRNYIPVTDNSKLIQDPPDPKLVNSFRKK